jgi:transcription termination factor Rho
MDADEHDALMALRKVLAGVASDGPPAVAGMNLLLDRLRTSRTNAEFLTEIAKAP